jgi:hypothetical protein
MSNNGLAVGAAWDQNNVMKHWVWDGKQYVFPTFPPDWDVSGFWAGPEFINNSGSVAGQYADKSGVLHGYFYDGRNITTFDAPRDAVLGDPIGGTTVNDITDAGDVVVNGGYGLWAPDKPRPTVRNFSWRNGVFTPLPNVPFAGAIETDVFGLNDRGDISGRWLDGHDGLWRSFIAFRKTGPKR